MFFKLLMDVLSLFKKIADIFRQRQQLQAGQAQATAIEAKESLDAVVEANAARDGARRNDAGATSTDQLPDDGFRRD